jgi:hypothetical protein
MFIRGLQFYTFFGISIGITRRLIDIGKKITLLFAKCLKMYSFFRICILRLQKVLQYYDPKIFFLEKYQYGYQKHAEFYADFKFVDADLNKCP